MTDERKTALVTGASRGIGQAIAGALVEAGFKVLGTATTEEGASRISEALGDQGGGYVLDISDTDSIDALFDRIKAEHDMPLVLVNNAGITRASLAICQIRMKNCENDAL